jgi:hypothetical protein
MVFTGPCGDKGQMGGGGITHLPLSVNQRIGSGINSFEPRRETVTRTDSKKTASSSQPVNGPLARRWQAGRARLEIYKDLF